jgi:hypothetical protein
MRLAFSMGKRANGGYSRAAIEKKEYQINNPRAEVQAENKWTVDFAGHNQVKAVIEKHPAICHRNHTAGCLPCQNGTAKNPQTRWRQNVTGVSPPSRRRQPTPQPTPEGTPALPGSPPTPTGNTSRVEYSHIIHLPVGYEYLHTSLPYAESLTLDASAQE